METQHRLDQAAGLIPLPDVLLQRNRAHSRVVLAPADTDEFFKTFARRKVGECELENVICQARTLHIGCNAKSEQMSNCAFRIVDTAEPRVRRMQQLLNTIYPLRIERANHPTVLLHHHLPERKLNDAAT
ncbi:hypothetical protein BOTU111921_13640 [Bordetella tumbae]